jgi:hypothetical protein
VQKKIAEEGQQRQERAAKQKAEWEARLREEKEAKERAEKEAKERAEKEKEKADGIAREKVDERAEPHLKFAKKLIEKGMTEKARERLREIIRDFPLSKTTEDARKLLEKLDKEAKDAGEKP